MTLSCVVTSASHVRWYKGGTLQRPTADLRQTFDGREARLEIHEVFEEDGGLYTCVACSACGQEATSSCTVTVTGVCVGGGCNHVVNQSACQAAEAQGPREQGANK